MGFKCIPDEKIKELTPVAKRVAEITNISLSSGLPFVGGSAFSHKAGMHIDAVLKNPEAYEHISPEAVGNERVFLMSEVAGRSTIIEKIQKIDPTITKSSPKVQELVSKMKELEFQGYQFEGADGSFELLARKVIGRYKPFFKLHYYQTSGINPRAEEGVCACAQIKLEVENQIRLTDYKVRVLDGKSATASKVRVLIESSDGKNTWTTVGVSCDVMEASWLALCDSFEYKLINDIEKHLGK